MASELINSVLDAESKAARQVQLAQSDAAAVVEFTSAKALECREKSREEAKAKAAELIDEAEFAAKGFVSQAEKLAELRTKKMIGEIEGKYTEAIDAVIRHILG